MKFRFKQNFIAGIAALLPLGITIYIIYLLVQTTGGKIGSFLRNYPAFKNLPTAFSALIGMFLVFIFIYLVGLLATTILGSRILKFGDKILKKLPLIRGIYKSTQKLSDALFGHRTAFKKVVLLEFPKDGTYALGFVTSERTWEIGEEKYLNIYVPTTPNPTSGWFLVVPASKVKFLPFSVDEAMQMVISGGIVLPEGGDKKFLYGLKGEIQKSMEKE